MYRIELMQTQGKNRGMFIKGYTGILPRPGRSFGVIFGDDEVKNVLNTSTVLSVDEGEDAILFETSNSSYLLRLIDIPE